MEAQKIGRKKCPSDSILTELTYIVRQKEKPYFESAFSTGGEPKVFFKTEKRKTKIYNMRSSSLALSIDVTGFELLQHRTKVADFYDIELVNTQYNREIEEFLKSITSADSVKIFDHTRRSNSVSGAANPDGKRGPAIRVHADYTVSSGPKRAMDVLGEEEYEKITGSGGRIVQINVWRPIRGPVESSPLALADATSVPKTDLIATDQRFPDRIGEIYQLAYGNGHRWYYAPKMMPDEVILIKGWDSVDDGRAQFTPHGAFKHPDENVNTKPRESIETRTYLVFNA